MRGRLTSEQNKKHRKKLRRTGFCLWILLTAVLWGLTGCSSRLASSGRTGNTEKEYTQGQLMVVAATERNRYQNIYSKELWEVRAGDGGITFEDKLKEQIRQFLTELAAMNMMARERGVELSSQEKDSVKALSQEYYDSLSEGDRAYMNVSLGEIEDLYSQYYLADKLVAELTSGEDLEVSDAEAKVIQIQQIRVDSEEEARRFLEESGKERADFKTIASKNSQDSQVEYTLEWSSSMDSLTEAAFRLEQDEISQVLEADGSFYIQKCTNAYDEEATAARKTVLAQEKKTKAFQAIYEPYVKEHRVTLKEGLWVQVDFQGGEDCTSDVFFQMYHEYFSRS